jgi:hypothetical protein
MWHLALMRQVSQLLDVEVGSRGNGHKVVVEQDLRRPLTCGLDLGDPWPIVSHPRYQHRAVGAVYMGSDACLSVAKHVLDCVERAVDSNFSANHLR